MRISTASKRLQAMGGFLGETITGVLFSPFNTRSPWRMPIRPRTRFQVTSSSVRKLCQTIGSVMRAEEETAGADTVAEDASWSSKRYGVNGVGPATGGLGALPQLAKRKTMRMNAERRRNLFSRTLHTHRQ